jgi:hypothetical protein
MDNPDTDNIGYTRHRTKVRENQRGNQEFDKKENVKYLK